MKINEFLLIFIAVLLLLFSCQSSVNLASSNFSNNTTGISLAYTDSYKEETTNLIKKENPVIQNENSENKIENCSSTVETTVINDAEKLRQEESIDENFEDYYSLSKNDSTKEESFLAGQVFESLVKLNAPSSSSSFSSLGFDVTEEDVLLYAKSATLIGDTENAYRMLTYLGYSVGPEELAKAEINSKATSLIKEGNYDEAFQLLSENSYYDAFKEFRMEMVEKYIINFEIGDIGPAGGYIFYDKGDFSGGWRYLEVAPSDLSSRYLFGFYRPDGITNTRVGTVCTIGAGKDNTHALVSSMGNKAYRDSKSKETEVYAAKVCEEYSLNGYDDWFLPSIDELDLMYENLHKKGLGDFKEACYWSSSDYYSSNAWKQNFSSGYKFSSGRNSYSYVRPVRAF